MSDVAPLRIGIDVRKTDPVESGQQRYLWRLGGWLADRGDDVRYLTVLDQPDDVPLPAGTRLHRLHGLGRARLRRRVAELELDVLLLNPERSRDFRGVHANALRPAYGTEHYRQKLRSFRTPLRSLARRALRLAPWEALERRWERGFYENPDPPPQVIAVSEYLRRQILDAYRVPPSHVHVVHNGIDLDEFSPGRRAGLRTAERERWSIPGDAFCLLFMGHNFRLKGLWQIMEVTRRLRTDHPEADLHLLVAGRGTGRRQRARARRFIQEHGLEGAIHVVGPVRPAIRAFAAADAFVHLSWHDSFGFVTLEAMASGLPVVTTPFVGAAEIITDGESGLLVDPRDPADVLATVRSLLREDVRRRVGEAAAAVGAAHPEAAVFARLREIFVLARDQADGPVQ